MNQTNANIEGYEKQIKYAQDIINRINEHIETVRKIDDRDGWDRAVNKVDDFLNEYAAVYCFDAGSYIEYFKKYNVKSLAMMAFNKFKRDERAKIKGLEIKIMSI